MTNNNLPTLIDYQPNIDLVYCRVHTEQFPRIEAEGIDKAIVKMTPLVFAAMLYKGQEATKERVAYIARSLVLEIFSDTQLGLRTLTWEEIGYTIRNAVLGVSGEMYGVSVATLYAALAAYAKGEGTEIARKAYQIKKSETL